MKMTRRNFLSTSAVAALACGASLTAHAAGSTDENSLNFITDIFKDSTQPGEIEEATAITAEKNAEWYEKLDFSDRREFANAERGWLDNAEGRIIDGEDNGLNQVSKLAVSFSASKPYFDKITIHAGEAQLPDFGLPTLQEGITVKDVSFGYDEKKPILVHMNAEFKKGGKYALTGPSGCGKSTLLKILLGWLPGYQGKVLYDERDVRDYTPEQLQQKMSYIEQNVFLFNTTIRENITLGEHFTDEQMEKALRDSALAGDLANMPKGLDTPVGEEGNALSGGQKQRVAIARALIHNRSILLVDEGTSALDQKNADIVEKSLLSNPDLTLILISHHLSDERKAQFDHVYELTPASSIV